MDILLSSDILDDKIARMAEIIEVDYKDKDPILLVVLKGAFYFAAELSSQINIPHTLEFVSIRSYDGTHPLSVDPLVHLPRINWRNRYVLIVEDIVDSGRTTHYLIKALAECLVGEVRIATMLDKMSARTHPEVNEYVKYVGFVVPNRFVLGRGLDLNESHRWLRDVLVLRDG